MTRDSLAWIRDQWDVAQYYGDDAENDFEEERGRSVKRQRLTVNASSPGQESVISLADARFSSVDSGIADPVGDSKMHIAGFGLDLKCTCLNASDATTTDDHLQEQVIFTYRDSSTYLPKLTSATPSHVDLNCILCCT
jgi:hypothetical protein